MKPEARLDFHSIDAKMTIKTEVGTTRQFVKERFSMRHRLFAWMSALGVLTAAVLWLAVPVASQAPRVQTTKGSVPAKAAMPWKAPRTADGQPDLQGVWNFSTSTPLERPNDLGGKQVLTDEEAVEFSDREAAKADHDKNPPADIVGNYNEFWYDGNKKVVGTKRTSLIVDPADGRIPSLTPEAQKRQQVAADARRGVGPDEPTPGGWVEDLGPGHLRVRCIMGFNSGPPMTPGAYNQNVQLLQSPGYVVILNEMIHNARIVPMDGRARGNIRQWVGDSRGRWEGETLVVDTRNFLRETAFNNGRTTASLHLVERFRRVDADTLLYEFTVEDPSTWTRPWTAQITMAKSEQPMYEYACHEGNHGLPGILAGARANERAAEEAAKKGSR